MIESIDIISLFKAKATEYVKYALSVLSKELPSEKSESKISTSFQDNIIDNIVEHDPGKRDSIKSISQWYYLLSLGPCQPKLSIYPINVSIVIGKLRTFSANWYNEYPYLEYSIFNDSVYYYICCLLNF